MVSDFSSVRLVHLKSERVASYTHFFGAVCTIIGYILLLIQGFHFPITIFIISVYSFSTLLLFLASGIFHAFKSHENANSLWRKLDHIGIFFMIAGTYTPICFLYLNTIWAIIILSAQWSLVLFGIILKVIRINTKRWITTSIYLLQGWMVILPFYSIVQVMPSTLIVLLAAGGVVYTIGAIIYIRQKPNPFPNVFGFHEIFHVLILLGAFLHYLVIFFGMKNSVLL